MPIKVYAHKEQGRRDYQQDEFFFRGNCFGVADGMGGHANGEEASASIVSVFEKGYDFDWMNDDDFLYNIPVVADKICRNFNDKRGSTYVGARYEDGIVEYTWAGDSHLYHVSKDGKMVRLTEPHEDESWNKYNPPLTNAVGFLQFVSEGKADVQPGDFILAVTDGIDYFPNTKFFEVIKESLAEEKNPAKEICIQAIQDYGSMDNCAVVIAEILED